MMVLGQHPYLQNILLILMDYGIKMAFLKRKDANPPGPVKSAGHELLTGEIFFNLEEAQVLIERGRRHYHQVRPPGSIGSRRPAPEAREIYPGDPGEAQCSQGL